MQFSHPGRGGRGEGAQGLCQRGVCPLWSTTRPKKGVLAGVVIPRPCPWAGANFPINRILLVSYRIAWVSFVPGPGGAIQLVDPVRTHRRTHVIPLEGQMNVRRPISRFNAIANIANGSL